MKNEAWSFCEGGTELFQNEIQTFYNNAVLSANGCTLWFGLGVVVKSSGKAAWPYVRGEECGPVQLRKDM